jgi:hypothetical protein
MADGSLWVGWVRPAGADWRLVVNHKTREKCERLLLAAVEKLGGSGWATCLREDWTPTRWTQMWAFEDGKPSRPPRRPSLPARRSWYR